MSHHKCISYEVLESCIQKASKEVITKQYKIPQKPQIFGYDKSLKIEIKRRRNLCSLWKKEKDETKKQEKGQEYRIQKEKVNEMMDTLEAEQAKKIINKNGIEGIDF